MLSLLTQCTMFCFTCFANVLPLKIFISSSNKSPSLLFALTCDYCTCLSFFASQSCSLLQMDFSTQVLESTLSPQSFLKTLPGNRVGGRGRCLWAEVCFSPALETSLQGRFLDFYFSVDPFHPGLLGSVRGAVIQCLSISGALEVCPREADWNHPLLFVIHFSAIRV